MRVNKNYSLKFGHLNVRSLIKHLNDITIMLHVHQFDFLALSETWLHSRITNKLLHINNYKLLRGDRINNRWGGVALYFRASLNIKLLASGCFGKVEFLASELISKFGKILLLVIYNPSPVVSVDSDNLNAIFTQYLSEYKKVVCLGDFNYNMLIGNKLNTCFQIHNLFSSPFGPTS